MNRSMRIALDKLFFWLQQRIRWITRPLILTIAFLVASNATRAGLLAKVGNWLGFASPSIVSMVAVMILIFLVERVVILEEKLRPPVKVYETRKDAYRELEELTAMRHIKKIELIQFTGLTALNFLQNVIRRCPGVKIRMLLASDRLATSYNRAQEDHGAQIDATIQRLDQAGGNLSVRRYSTSASLSCIIIDDQIVLLGWYRISYDNGGIRLHGYDSPGVMAIGMEASHLLTVAHKHFENLWGRDEEPIEKVPKPTASPQPPQRHPFPLYFWKTHRDS